MMARNTSLGGGSYRIIQQDELELLQEHFAPPQIKPTITEPESI